MTYSPAIRNAAETSRDDNQDATGFVLQPVILAGGSGTRLWPLSREQQPKQLIDLVDQTSLLQNTARRLSALTDIAPVAAQAILVCGDSHRFMSAAQLKQIGQEAHILLEPAPRNTAPALTVAARYALSRADDSILVVMPADHAIPDAAAFLDAVRCAAKYAADGAIVTLGVVPQRAETGYGYIEVGPALSSHGGYTIKHFVEKPHQELAEHYLQAGRYWWNSGIFIVRASVWLAVIEALQPEISQACTLALDQGQADGPFFRLDAKAFQACPTDSIDYAVMERLDLQGGLPGVVVPLLAGWSDIGTWNAVWEYLDKDEHDNATQGRVLTEDTQSSLIRADGRLVACIGLRDVVVIETPDAVLVANKDAAQQVRHIVGTLKAQNAIEAVSHSKVYRPWGYYDSISAGERFQVKRIVVNPGASLSLQMHYHRAEHWVVVRGTAKVTCGEAIFLLSENQSTFIPLGTKHRLENPGKTQLEIIEVQSGAYLDEDDIVRFDDNYGRVPSQSSTVS